MVPVTNHPVILLILINAIEPGSNVELAVPETVVARFLNNKFHNCDGMRNIKKVMQKYRLRHKLRI